MTDTLDGLEDRILAMAIERGQGNANSKTVCPSEVARDLVGSDEKRWRLLMAPIRKAAVALAIAGKVEIRRKGRPVDPLDFRGIYRIAAVGDGSSESIRPESQ